MVLFIVVASALILLAAYYTYGKFLANTVFKLDDKNPVPSVEMEDGVDYVPAKKGMLLCLASTFRLLQLPALLTGLSWQR